MPEVLLATPEMATEYARWFVNRLAYTRQSDRPHSASGRHYYYRPRAEGGGERGLELDDVRRHLAGEISLPDAARGGVADTCFSPVVTVLRRPLDMRAGSLHLAYLRPSERSRERAVHSTSHVFTCVAAQRSR